MMLARRLGLGRLLYVYFHRPIGEWRTNEARMARAAAKLSQPDLPFLADAWPTCRYLTGHAFWYQTAFCARSLEIACGTSLRFKFFDDGTLLPTESELLRNLFPHSTVVSSVESEVTVDSVLPASRFPLLRAARAACPLMRKLIDLRCAGGTQSLCLDSDMLFFAPAPELRVWLERPVVNHFLFDVIENYIAPRGVLEAETHIAILPAVNTGLVAMDDSRIDWEYLERFLSLISPAFRSHRLLEQTLTAVHLAQTGGTMLPPESYRVLVRPFTEPPTGILLHYCWDSNPTYRQTEWRRFSASAYAKAAGRTSLLPGRFGS